MWRDRRAVLLVATATLTATATVSGTAVPATSADDAGSGGSGPGFGPLAAVAGIVGSLALARRRRSG